MKDWIRDVTDLSLDVDAQMKKALIGVNGLALQGRMNGIQGAFTGIMDGQKAAILASDAASAAASARMIAQIGAPAIAVRDSVIKLTANVAAMPRTDYSIGMLQSTSFFQALPTFTSLTKTLDQLLTTLAAAEADEQAGMQVLDEADFKFVANYLTAHVFRDFATVDPRVRSAVITNSLRGFVNSADFLESLEAAAHASPIVRRRWHILEKGLTHQRRRDYFVSVPVLMPQFEGILADTLILRSLVERSGSKLYELDPASGTRRLGNNGKPIEVNGLAALILRSKYQGSPELGFLAEHVSNRLCSQRNGVLHGADVRYGNAKLSISLTVLIATMVDAIAELEAAAAK